MQVPHPLVSALARSALGSPSGRAGSPNGLTERVSSVYCNAPHSSNRTPSASRRACMLIWVLAKIRGFGRILSATTTSAAKPPTSMSTPTRAYRLKVCTAWLPPGGSCHDEISALRNRYFVVTDEGWRWLKVLDFPVEWRKQEHMPLIRLHSFTNLSPPLISLFCQSVPKCRLPKNPASPRGKPRNASPLAVRKLLVRTVYYRGECIHLSTS